jgi:hypothetical protein
MAGLVSDSYGNESQSRSYGHGLWSNPQHLDLIAHFLSGSTERRGFVKGVIPILLPFHALFLGYIPIASSSSFIANRRYRLDSLALASNTASLRVLGFFDRYKSLSCRSEAISSLKHMTRC